VFFVCLYGYGLLSSGKDRGVKFCMRVGLLSRQAFSLFGELWLAGSHGGGGNTSGMYTSTHWCHAVAAVEAWWTVGIAGGGVA